MVTTMSCFDTTALQSRGMVTDCQLQQPTAVVMRFIYHVTWSCDLLLNVTRPAACHYHHASDIFDSWRQTAYTTQSLYTTNNVIT